MLLMLRLILAVFLNLRMIWAMLFDVKVDLSKDIDLLVI